MDVATAVSGGTASSEQLPFAPSWVDVLQTRVTSLPWPAWLTYVGAWGLLVAVEAVGRSASGADAAVWPFLLMGLALAPFALGFMDHLDRFAARAVRRLRLAEGHDTAWLDRCLQELTTMPLLGCAVALAVGSGLGLFQRFAFTDPYLSSLGLATAGWLYYLELLAMPVFGWAALGAFVYHALRQVILVDRLYRSPAVVVDVFGANRFHAFAGFSARMSIGIILFCYLWLLAYPNVESQPVARLNIGIILIMTVVAFALFFLPLWGAHRRLAVAKADRLAYCATLMESVLAEQHKLVEEGRFGEVKPLNETVAALAGEVALVERTSTWPWSPNLFRGFVTAVLLPMLLFGAQQFIVRILLS